ncbi:MAG: hypothetical protein ACR2HH_08370 [Chthoniobacterales bacterium]
MKKVPVTNSARITLAALLMLAGIGLFCAIPLIKTARAQVPTSGVINPTDVTPQAWNGTSLGVGAAMESACVDAPPAVPPANNCENYMLTLTGQPSDWAGKKVKVELTWMDSNVTEYDIYIHNSQNAVITSSMQGPGLSNQVAFIDPASAGTGVFRIHVARATALNPATDPYHGTASVVSTTGGGGTPTATPVPAPLDTVGKVGYENFEAPGVITPVVVTSSGGATVEYLGRGAGEPSLGVNWVSTSPSAGGMVNFQSDLETLFISFDESNSPTTPKATWVNRRAPSSSAVDSDPIGFTDHQTGRVFASELTLLSPDTSKISFSDDDGVNWTFDPQAQGPASAVDHQTIGGGPYHAPLFAPPPPLYPNAVYYCSQDIAAAFCTRSDNGGTAFTGTQTPLYTVNQCGGLHGHVKVAPDGTVYVPNRACGGNSAVVVSTNNGISWTVRPITNGSVPATPASDDPATAIDASGRVYTLLSFNGTQAAVAVSTDQGATWKNIYDLSSALGVKNVAFPAAVAGDAGRAAVAFYGTVTGTGDSSANNFTGVWHLYVSQTFDGGARWTTTDVTPNLPMQRMGLLRGGGGPLQRNLLDFFDIQYDRDGRVVVGYVNGCSGGPCSQAPIAGDGSTPVVGNTYSATASIARQSSGRRLLAANDPASTTSVPGIPFATEVRIGNTVRLAWNEADTGNLPLTGYQILRGTTSGGESLLIDNLPGTTTSYTDMTATDPTKTYYYQVVAKNSAGNSPARNEIAAPYIGDTCSGLIIHRNLPSHPESTGGSASQPPLPQLLIDYIAAGEPPSKPGQFMFKMKVGNLTTVPPDSRWRVVWDYIGSAANPNPDEQFYVGMTSSSSNPPVVTFEYGTVSTLSAVIIGVPTENPKGTADAASNFNADGTITIFVPKTGVGSPGLGDLLGAVNGRTFNSPGTAERSTLLIDHTFVKGGTDNSFPPATYTVSGNNSCSANALVPVGAVSRKTHGTAGDFDIDLPFTGSTGIESRTGPVAGQHTVVFTYSVPVNVTTATATCGGLPATRSASGSQVTVTCTGIANSQTIAVSLSGVSDGTNSGNVSVPMGLLLGDVDASRVVDGNDVSNVQGHTRETPNSSNFRADVDTSGLVDGNDVSITQGQTRSALSRPSRPRAR